MALAEWLPYALCALAAVLAWFFHSSRGVLTALLLAGLSACVQAFDARGSLHLAWSGLCWLVPLDLMLLSLLKERGLASAAGQWRLGALAVQGLVVAWLTLPSAADLQWLLEDAPLPFPTSFPQLAALWCVISLLVLVGRLWLTASPLDSGSIAVLAGSVLALVAPSRPAALLYLTAAAGALVWSLIQHSYGMAYIDELTGLPGRRALRDEMAALEGQYAIAMVDIDHFKGFNDKYGHDVGDQCLRLVASHLQRVADGGKAFRYGGEEFTVLFPGKAVAEALDPLESLRRNIEAKPFIVRAPGRPRQKPERPRPAAGPQAKVTVTVSIGVAERNGRNDLPDEVVKAADKALYKAKKRGRNQVCK